MRLGNAGLVLTPMAIGAGVGIVIANTYFVGDDVLRAARALFGFFGVMIGGYFGNWLVTHKAEQLRLKLAAARRAELSKVAVALAVVVFTSMASWPAQAQEMSGWVLDFNPIAETFVLNNFQNFRIAPGLVPADFRIGSSVRITFEDGNAGTGDRTVTSITMLCQSYGAACTGAAGSE